jgi:hypothetical protein
MISVFYNRQYVDVGGLFSYGVSFTETFRRAAYYVDRIARGEKPSELPIEAPTKYELVINLKTAKALGITMPTSLGDRITALFAATHFVSYWHVASFRCGDMLWTLLDVKRNTATVRCMSIRRE